MLKQTVPVEVTKQIIRVIDKDNRASGMYGGLAQFTNGYDAAVERIKNIIQALSDKD